MSYGVFAYGLMAGAGAVIGVLYLLLGLRRTESRSQELSISLLGFAVAVSTIVHVQLQSSRDVAEYAALIRGPFALSGLLLILALVWAIGALSGVGWPRVPLAMSAATVAVLIANYLAPGGLIVEKVTALRRVTLFGDRFVVHEPNTSSWRMLLNAYLIAVLVYCAVCLIRWRRSGPRGSPSRLYVGSGLVVAFSLMLYDSLVDEGLTNTVYLAPFGSIALTIGLALQHAEMISGIERRLVAYSSDLERLVSERTRALHNANRSVIEQLRKEQQIARHLARLSHQFVLLNAVVERRSQAAQFERALEGAIGCVGDLVQANGVCLDLRESRDRRTQPSTVTWQSPDRGAASPDGETRLVLPLRVGDLVLGELEISWSGETRRSDEQQQLIDLTTDYLAAVLHRLDLAAAVVGAAVDSERQRIARDLHDSVSQRLYAAAFNADSVAQLIERDPGLVSDRVGEIRMLVLVAVAEMRTLLFELQPRLLETASLSALIAGLCESVGASHGHSIEVVTRDGPGIPTEPKLVFYRVAQEAITNALRHASARQIRVGIALDASGATLEVSDDGIGFESGREHGHGLRNMKARAEEIGALLYLSSNQGAGTTVSLFWPRQPSGARELDGADDEAIESESAMAPETDGPHAGG